MDITSKQIIEYIEKSYPVQDSVRIKHITDTSIETQGQPLVQLILGLTPTDPFAGGSRNYELVMTRKLSGVSSNIKTLGWTVNDYEYDDIAITLTEIAAHFNIDLDLERMLKSAEIKRNQGKSYVIVITVVQYQIVSAYSTG